jgi:hypothetical protein
MRRAFREAEKIIAELGLTIVETYRSRHQTYVLRTSDGRTLNTQVPHDMSAPRQWKNWRTQLRRRINGLAEKAATTGEGANRPEGGV